MYTQRTFGLFQRKFENRVVHIPFVRSGDILISGKKDKDHLENLGQVMGIIQENGLRLKFWKYVFMADKVIYLGFNINKNSVTPVKEKIENKRTTKEPRTTILKTS